jgi:serralysin
MPSFTPIGTDTLVNTNTADGQITPRVVQLADGKYMVIWVGSVVLPVVIIGGTFAAAYANADIRAQIYNADGTPSGGEIVINTTTAGAQLRPVVAQLSDGNVLISWHDGVGPSGGPAEITPNTIRAQEFTSTGVATGGEFAIGNSNGRLHSIAATTNGGFVVTYQEGGVGGALAVGNIVTQVYNSSNVQTGGFVVDNTLLLASTTHTVTEADGDIIVYWFDRNPITNVTSWRSNRYDVNGNLVGDQTFIPQYTITGALPLATGGHMFFGFYNPGSGQPITLFAEMMSVDGNLSRYVEVAVVPVGVGTITATPLTNGGFIMSWGVDSDPGTGLNAEIMAQVYNAIGDPIGDAFQVNSTTTLNQSSPSFVQTTDGDIVAAWIDDSLLNGDTSGTGIVSRRIDFDPANQNPTASDFTLTLLGVAQGEAVNYDPVGSDFLGLTGLDADGDTLVLSSVSNVSNGTVILNPDGTLTMTTTPGATERLSFDYTISDGNGGFATARATVTLPTDYVTLRPGETATVDFLANDYYTPTAGATAFTLTSPSPIFGGTPEGSAAFVSTQSGQRIFYNPLGVPTQGTDPLNSSYFNLLVGQTTQARFYYGNNEANANVNITLEGWAQLGGTGADNLVGTSRPDHLSGGTGAANVLTGGAGDDWYTISAAGDQIVELVTEGRDSARVALSSYTLADNVENLRFFGVLNTLRVGTGNALDNYMSSGTDRGELYGLGGNDLLVGSVFDDFLAGGDGDDILVGVSGVDRLWGGAGNDRLYLGPNATGANVDGDIGIDTLYVSGTVSSFFNLYRIEALNLSAGSAITLTGSQFGIGLASNTGVTGSGSITVNMHVGVNFLSQGFVFNGTGVTLTVNGTSGADTIKAGTAVHTINAGGGNDQIRGGISADTINGGDGNDKIIGFTGADNITGGAGSDQFRYLFATDSGLGGASDIITDFTIGSDRLNFALFDTNAGLAGVQGFAFVGNAAFSGGGAAQIRYTSSGADLRVQADIDGDGDADMEITLMFLNGQTLTAADFIL